MELAADNNLSEVICRILDSLGLDEENRQRRMRVQRVGQLMDTWYYKNIDLQAYNMIPLYVGSSYETTSIGGLSSDSDRLITYDFNIIDDIEQWFPYDKDEEIMCMIDEKDCYHSYVKIYVLSPYKRGPLYHNKDKPVSPMCVIDEDGKSYFGSQLTIEFLKKTGMHPTQGPAMQSGDFNRDYVVALRCDFFPRSALRWKERQTTETLSRVGESIVNEADYCYVVPVGNKSSPNVNLEWRYAFTHLERRLVHAWNNVQYKLYVMMKFILKDLIKPEVPNVISSYHIKTILLWMNEEYRRECFEMPNFNQCLLTYLKNLLDTVKRQSLPHYFIEECNLYNNKMDDTTSQQLTETIQVIIDTWPRKLFDIESRELGFELKYVLSGVPLKTRCDIIKNERRDRTTFEMQGESKGVYDRIHKMKIEFNKKAISEVESLLEIINQEVDDSPDIELDMEMKDFVDGIKHDFLCDFAIHFLIRSSITPTETEMSDVAEAQTYILRYAYNCHIDTRLKIAAYWVFTHDLQKGALLLDDIERQIKPYTVYTCNHESCTTEFTPSFKGMHDNKPTLSEIFTYYFAYQIEYQSDMIGHLPKALKYEMFRSTSVSPKPFHHMDDFKWHKHAVILPPVFMYFLRYVIAQSEGLHDESERALDTMKAKLIQLEINGAPHCETNYNIIAHCHMERGDTQRAFKEYRRSLIFKQHHNAAIWQIVVLLMRQIGGEQ